MAVAWTSIGPKFEDHYGIFAKPDCTGDDRFEPSLVETSMETFLQKQLAAWDTCAREEYMQLLKRSPGTDDSH
jgi:hypothetical protein